MSISRFFVVRDHRKYRILSNRKNGNDDSTTKGAAMGITIFNLLVDGVLPPIPKNNEDDSSEEMIH